MEVKPINKANASSSQSDQLEIIYYTDPLCCWSWAFEPQWRRLLYEFAGQIKYRYCMGGLLPGWKNYNDSVNSVSKPIQMGPVWMHAGQLSGMPIQHNVWIHDAPASSYPACIAVKCAALQSQKAEEMYLRLLREAIMIRAENIAKHPVLLHLAEKISIIIAEFSMSQFKEDLKNDNGLEAFRKDLQEVQYHNINRFPSLVIKNTMNQAIIISGYRPYSVLLSAVKQLVELKKTREAISLEEYKDYWPSLTERELAEIN
jgi:predicted DsbA family dithiol-disulfide isomerase